MPTRQHAACCTRVVDFDDLTTAELHGIYRLRTTVFVVEQRICCVEEIDAEDPRSVHLIADDTNSARRDPLLPLGTARLTPPSADNRAGDDRWRVCRVAVRAPSRGQGIGAALLRAAGGWLDQHRHPGELHAQAHLEAWYARHGWTRVGDGFEEAQIPHVTMVREPH